MPGKRYASFAVAISHPVSRGTVHIGSADPLAAPVIDHNMLDNDVDMQTMIEGIKYARRLTQTEAFSKIIEEELYPGPNVQSDDDLRVYLKKNSMTMWHPVGTAALRPRGEKGVVDSSLKVYGTKNLRVVRTSSATDSRTTHHFSRSTLPSSLFKFLTIPLQPSMPSLKRCASLVFPFLS